jgi:hypothetical protein
VIGDGVAKKLLVFTATDQTFFCCDNAGRQIVKKVIHLETLQTDWEQVTAELGLSGLKLPHKNRDNVRDGAHADEFYGREMRQLVNQIYARDFDTFGYDRVS